MARSMLNALLDKEKLGTLANPGEATSLGPTIPMRVGATLNPFIQKAKDLYFPKEGGYAGEYGQFDALRSLGGLLLGDSPERTARMAEGIPHQYTGAGPNDPIIRPEIVDLAGALPIATALNLGKAAVVPGAAFAASKLAERGLGITDAVKKAQQEGPTMADILLGAGLQRQGALDEAMVTYHGSPHRFDQLDPSKIGTGEGAQAYGHGVYVAESKGVAQTYQPRDFDAEEIMMARYKEAEARGDYNRMEQWENAMLHETPDDLRERSLDMDYDEDYRQAAAEVAEELAAIPSTSHLYEIDVPDEDIAKMLDWDAPLSEQPEGVAFAFEELEGSGLPRDTLEPGQQAGQSGWQLYDKETGFLDPNYSFSSEKEALDFLENPKGSDIYEYLSGGSHGPMQADVSEALQAAGIPGIKYYDQGSRAAGDGTRNMVLFDDLAKRAKVLKRNDEKIAEPSVDVLHGLRVDALKASSFEDFKKDYTQQIKHGKYYHITEDPNFRIDPEKGASDTMSYSTSKPQKGSLMITSDLPYWAEGYQDSRKYVAEIDMSDVPRNDYKQVGRGQGNEFFIENASKAKVKRVVPLDEAIEEADAYSKQIPQSEEELKRFYDATHAQAEPSVDEFIGNLLSDEL